MKNIILITNTNCMDENTITSIPTYVKYNRMILSNSTAASKLLSENRNPNPAEQVVGYGAGPQHSWPIITKPTWSYYSILIGLPSLITWPSLPHHITLLYVDNKNNSYAMQPTNVVFQKADYKDSKYFSFSTLWCRHNSGNRSSY